MAFNRKPGEYYRMPVFFGAQPCPRWWPEGVDEDFSVVPQRTVMGISYLSDRKVLEAGLPDGFSVWGEPVVTVEATYMTGFAWLAGGGYNMCDVKIPAVFQSKDGPIHGTLLMVRWEDLADPIITGREELGHNKLFCDIGPIQNYSGRYHARMSWRGYSFLKLIIEDLVEQDPPAGNPDNKGLLSYKYIPATGNWGEPDVAYATLTPPAWGGVKTTLYRTGKGQVEWQRPAFEDLPTQYTIVNGFAGFPMLESRGAFIADMTGGASGSATYRVD